MAKLANKSPGPKYGAPNTIGYENTDLRLPRAPAYTFGKLLDFKRTSGRVPGPKYNLRDVTRHGPVNVVGASFASKHGNNLMTATRTPGPAAYNIVPCMSVTMPTMPMYSIGWVLIFIFTSIRSLLIQKFGHFRHLFHRIFLKSDRFVIVIFQITRRILFLFSRRIAKYFVFALNIYIVKLCHNSLVYNNILVIRLFFLGPDPRNSFLPNVYSL